MILRANQYKNCKVTTSDRNLVKSVNGTLHSVRIESEVLLQTISRTYASKPEEVQYHLEDMTSEYHDIFVSTWREEKGWRSEAVYDKFEGETYTFQSPVTLHRIEISATTRERVSQLPVGQVNKAVNIGNTPMIKINSNMDQDINTYNTVNRDINDLPNTSPVEVYNGNVVIPNYSSPIYAEQVDPYTIKIYGNFATYTAAYKGESAVYYSGPGTDYHRSEFKDWFLTSLEIKVYGQTAIIEDIETTQPDPPESPAFELPSSEILQVDAVVNSEPLFSYIASTVIKTFGAPRKIVTLDLLDEELDITLGDSFQLYDKLNNLRFAGAYFKVYNIKHRISTSHKRTIKALEV